MTITGDDYINRVLRALPRDTPRRAQIATELRGHIAERLTQGAPVGDVLAGLGDPAVLAASYLSAEPLVAASFGRRAAAKLVDVLCVVAAILPIAWLIARLSAPDLFEGILFVGTILGGSVAFGLYTMAAETVWGKTLGKRALGLRVVSDTGGRIGAGQAVVRQLGVLLQVYWIDVLFVFFTAHHQRAFELLSKTRVVRAPPQEAP